MALRLVLVAALSLLLGAGAGWAARSRRANPEPAPEAPSLEPVPEPSPPPPSEPAPEDALHNDLFPDGLPLALEALPAGLANLTAQQCAACHWDVHAGWETSAHATGWSGDVFRQAVRDASSPATCLECHLPLAAQQPTLAERYVDGDMAAPIHRPNEAWNPSLMEEGVTCAACHVRNGRVIGIRAAPDAPHPVEPSAALSHSAACATCHQRVFPGSAAPWYDTYGEWYRSPYREAGVRCQDCHMPPRSGVPSPARPAAFAGHAFEAHPGRAVSVLVTLPAAEVDRGQPFEFRIRVQNTGAGHAFPTGHPGRVVRLEAGLVAADGKALHAPLVHVFARTVDEAPPFAVTADTRLPPHGEVDLSLATTVPVKEKPGPATLRVTLSETGAADPLIVRSIPVTVR